MQRLLSLQEGLNCKSLRRKDSRMRCFHRCWFSCKMECCTKPCLLWTEDFVKIQCCSAAMGLYLFDSDRKGSLRFSCKRIFDNVSVLEMSSCPSLTYTPYMFLGSAVCYPFSVVLSTWPLILASIFTCSVSYSMLVTTSSLVFVEWGAFGLSSFTQLRGTNFVGLQVLMSAAVPVAALHRTANSEESNS